MKALTRKQELAVASLLSTSTIKDAAKAAGVSEVTLWRWLQDADFSTHYRAARRQVVERAVSELQAATGEAVEALKRNLHCAHAATEVRAAQLIIEQSVKGIELMEMEERVKALEDSIKAQQSEAGRGKNGFRKTG